MRNLSYRRRLRLERLFRVDAMPEDVECLLVLRDEVRQQLPLLLRGGRPQGFVVHFGDVGVFHQYKDGVLEPRVRIGIENRL